MGVRGVCGKVIRVLRGLWKFPRKVKETKTRSKAKDLGRKISRFNPSVAKPLSDNSAPTPGADGYRSNTTQRVNEAVDNFGALRE